MKGLAISNSKLLRESQNSLARPADLRGALNAAASSSQSKKPTRKRAKLTMTSTRKRAKDDSTETYHFIGYVPSHGKVWELDGLKSGPLEVGELDNDGHGIESWERVVRPALKLKMQKYGAPASAAEGDGAAGNIQFNLLALVPDNYERKSDALELLKRERAALERRLRELHGNSDAWKQEVDSDLLATVNDTSTATSTFHPFFALDAGLLKLKRDLATLQLPSSSLLGAWETCIGKMIAAKIEVDEEVQKAVRARADEVSRTFDYEPFIREFVTALHNEGLLAQCVGEGEA